MVRRGSTFASLTRLGESTRIRREIFGMAAPHCPEQMKPTAEVANATRRPTLSGTATCRRLKKAKNKSFESKVGAKMGANFDSPRQARKQKALLSRAFAVAGAGFEPATSGL
jgi:hypothetical protein